MNGNAALSPGDNDVLATVRERPSSGSLPGPAAAIAGDGVRLHGFDVFDTLITRCWWRPEDVFLEVGERLRGMGLMREAPQEWAARRVTAEAALRRVPGTEEVDLQGIYAALAADLGWTEAETQKAAQTELACEEDAVRPIAENVRRLARLRSDTPGSPPTRPSMSR